MIGLSLHENLHGRQDVDPEGGDGSPWNDFFEILPQEFEFSRKMRLHRTAPCKLGGNFEVELEISLSPGHSLDARTLSDILQRSAGECFDYALATSHPKTILTALSDGEGRIIGDTVASFRMGPRLECRKRTGFLP